MIHHPGGDVNGKLFWIIQMQYCINAIMSTGRSALGRPPRKQRQIVEALRARILDGGYPPSARLPTRLDLRRQHRASLATVQLALTQLARDGFVVARGKRGTFVAAHPPHLSQLALVIPALPDTVGFPRFWTALATAAMRHGRQKGAACSIRVDYGIDGHHDNAALLALEEDVRRWRLAGIVFASSPFLLRGSPVLEQPGLPRVAFMSRSQEFPDLARVEVDTASMFDAALQRLAQAGRRRLALVVPPGIESLLPVSCAKLAARHGLELRPYWHLTVNRGSPEAARNTVHLLMRLPRKDRPDALFISDDNLLEHASAGLFDADVRVPDEVQVVAHCNFPCPTPSAVPVCRVGFDAQIALQTSLDELAHQRAGGKPRTHRIPAGFAPEEPFLDETGGMTDYARCE